MLLAVKLDAAVFLGSSVLGLATGALDTAGLVVDGVDFVPEVVVAAPGAFGFVAAGLVVRGDLLGVVAVVLVGVALVVGFAVLADFAATFAPTDEALEAIEEPDAGLLFDRVVEPGV